MCGFQVAARAVDRSARRAAVFSFCWFPPSLCLYLLLYVWCPCACTVFILYCIFVLFLTANWPAKKSSFFLPIHPRAALHCYLCLPGGPDLTWQASFSLFLFFSPSGLTFPSMDSHVLLWSLLQVWIYCEFVSANWNNIPDGRITYTRDFLLQLGLLPHPSPSMDIFPEEILCKNSCCTENYTHNKNKVTRRGKKKGGIKARLKRETCKQRPLPSLILANVRSLRNETDELQANVNHMHEYRTASILAFTEMLNKNDDDSTLHIDGFTPPSQTRLGQWAHR